MPPGTRRPKRKPLSSPHANQTKEKPPANSSGSSKTPRDPACGRGHLTHDPAVVAIIDKLSSLMRLDPYEAHDQCAKRAL
jgi:hypothetical protein